MSKITQVSRPKNFYEKIQSSSVLIACVICYGLYGIFIRLSKKENGSEPYNIAATLVISELLKLTLSIFFLTTENGLGSAVDLIRQNSCKDWMLFALPAALYACTNNLDYYCLRYMDPGSFQVLSQLKIATTALFWQLVFRRSLKSHQKMGIIVIDVG
eukprot:UN31987